MMKLDKGDENMEDIAMTCVFILTLIIGDVIMKMTDEYLNNNREDDDQ